MLQKVVVVECGDEIDDRLRKVLGQHSSAEAITVPSGRRAVELARQIEVDLLVVRYPLDGMSFGDLVGEVKARSAASRGAQIIGLAPGRSIGGLARHRAPRVAFLRSDGDLDLLAENIVAYLRRSPRIEGSYAVKLRLEGEGAPILKLVQAKDISETGMFLRTKGALPIGAELSFELVIEDDAPIRGTAEVVRAADRTVADVVGVGVRFLKLAGDDYKRLVGYLDARRAEREMAAH